MLVFDFECNIEACNDVNMCSNVNIRRFLVYDIATLLSYGKREVLCLETLAHTHFDFFKVFMIVSLTILGVCGNWAGIWGMPLPYYSTIFTQTHVPINLQLMLSKFIQIVKQN